MVISNNNNNNIQKKHPELDAFLIYICSIYLLKYIFLLAYKL